ncbi:MAG: hypothetical protein AVDCRST_MAG88-3704, partial [uncultured Thermomicrobiales bacterium]
RGRPYPSGTGAARGRARGGTAAPRMAGIWPHRARTGRPGPGRTRQCALAWGAHRDAAQRRPRPGRDALRCRRPPGRGAGRGRRHARGRPAGHNRRTIRQRRLCPIRTPPPHWHAGALARGGERGAARQPRRRGTGGDADGRHGAARSLARRFGVGRGVPACAAGQADRRADRRDPDATARGKVAGL